MKARLMNWVSLSVMTLAGTLKRHTSPFRNLIADYAVTFLTSSTSGHFENLSMATYKNSKPPVARGKWPKMLSSQTEKGHDKGIVSRA
jgi:hypothetical protein